MSTPAPDPTPPTRDPIDAIAALADAAERLRAYAERRPSIGDDGDVILAADRYGALPKWATPFHLGSLIAHGYAEHVTGFDRAVGQQSSYVLTESGRKLRDLYAEIRGLTPVESKPYGLLTPPSAAEIHDNEHPDGNGTSLMRGRH